MHQSRCSLHTCLSRPIHTEIIKREAISVVLIKTEVITELECLTPVRNMLFSHQDYFYREVQRV